MMSIATSAGLELVARYGAAERWLAVLVTLRRGRRAEHERRQRRDPVAPGHRRRGRRLRRPRRHRQARQPAPPPRATLVFRAGWEWVAVTGPVELAGPDDDLRASAPTLCPACCARCSTRQAAPTTTWTPTTASWPPNVAPLCCCGPGGLINRYESGSFTAWTSAAAGTGVGVARWPRGTVGRSSWCFRPGRSA